MPREYTTIRLVMIFLALGTFLSVINLPKQASPSHAASHTVTYTNQGFTPQSLTIQRGDTVTFSNTSDAFLEFASDPHPIHTSYPLINLGLINQGSSKNATFNDVGTFGYHNHLEPSRTGLIIVQNPPTNTPTITQGIKLGDANGDNQVDGADFTIWLSHYNQNTLDGRRDGDFNTNGKVDGIDFSIWLLRYGT